MHKALTDGASKSRRYQMSTSWWSTHVIISWICASKLLKSWPCQQLAKA